MRSPPRQFSKRRRIGDSFTLDSLVDMRRLGTHSGHGVASYRTRKGKSGPPRVKVFRAGAPACCQSTHSSVSLVTDWGMSDKLASAYRMSIGGIFSWGGICCCHLEGRGELGGRLRRFPPVADLANRDRAAGRTRFSASQR